MIATGEVDLETHARGLVAPMDIIRLRYADIVCAFLDTGDDAYLDRARVMGREAIERGLSAADLLDLHARAIQLHPEIGLRSESLRCLAELLSPVDAMLQRSVAAEKSLLNLRAQLDREHERLATVLHDDIGQLLFGLELAIEELDQQMGSVASPRVTEILALCEELDRRVRHLGREFHPAVLEHLGLVDAVRCLVDRLARTKNLRLTLTHDEPLEPPAEIQRCLYRAIHESLINVVRHARATCVTVDLTATDGQIVCRVRDDGVGIAADAESSGIGLSAIRAYLRSVHGSVACGARVNGGTELVMCVPVSQEQSDGHSRVAC